MRHIASARLVALLVTGLAVGLVASGFATRSHSALAAEPSTTKAVDPRDNSLLSACGPGGQALHEVARSVALRSIRGEPAWTMVELGQRLRARGEPHPGARAWTLRAPQVDREIASERMRAWLASHGVSAPRRCGVASVQDSEHGEVVAVVAVPVLADLLVPLPATVAQGRWVTVDALVYDKPTEGKVLVVGPRGTPRTIPTHFGTTTEDSATGDSTTARVFGRFMADREGTWLVQVIACTATGPRHVIEAQVNVGDVKVAAQETVPGESAGHGLPDDQAIVAMLNEARVSEGLRPLSRDAAADGVAREHVRNMIAAGVVAHDVGEGLPPQRAARAGISSNEVGENVSRAANSTLVHRALWNSLSHRANMLHPRYERVGVAAARDKQGHLWVAQVFLGR